MAHVKWLAQCPELGKGSVFPAHDFSVRVEVNSVLFLSFEKPLSSLSWHFVFFLSLSLSPKWRCPPKLCPSHPRNYLSLLSHLEVSFLPVTSIPPSTPPTLTSLLLSFCFCLLSTTVFRDAVDIACSNWKQHFFPPLCSLSCYIQLPLSQSHSNLIINLGSSFLHSVYATSSLQPILWFQGPLVFIPFSFISCSWLLYMCLMWSFPHHWNLSWLFLSLWDFRTSVPSLTLC